MGKMKSGIPLIAAFLLICAIAFSDPVDTYNFAVTLYAQEMYDLAAEQFETFLKESPDHEKAGEAVYWAGESLLKEGNVEDAEKRFRRAVEEYPKSGKRTEAELRWAECAAMGGKHGEALKRYDGLLSDLGKGSAPNTTSAHLGRADCLYELGRFEDAEKSYLRALHKEDGQRNEYALYSAGWAARKAEAPERAAKHFSRLLKEMPQSDYAAEANYERGVALLECGQRKDAILAFDAVAKGVGEFADDASFALGRCHYEGGELEKAQEAFQTVLDRFPDSPLSAEVYFNQGVCLSEQGQHVEAAEAFSLAAKKNSEDFGQRASYWRGLSLHGADRVKDGEKALLQASQGKDEALASQAWKALGDLYYDIQSYARAADAYRSAKGEGTPKKEALYGLGLSLIKLEKHQEASGILRPLWQKDGDESLAPLSAFAEGHCLLAMEDPEGAKTCFRAVSERWPESEKAGEALLGLAWCIYREGRREEAAEAFQQAAEQVVEELKQEALCMAGGCLLEAGKYEEAGKILATAVELGEENQWGRRSRLRQGEALGRAEKYEEALAVLKRLEGGEYAREALFWRAWSLEGLDRYTEASALYREFLSTSDGEEFTGEAAQGLARCLGADEKWGEAASILTKLTEERGETKTGELEFQRIVCLEKSGKVQESIQLFAEFSEKWPDDERASEALFRAGESHFQSQSFGDAVEIFARALDASGVDAVMDKILYRKGWCHKELGDVEDAAKAWDSLCKTVPESDLASESCLLAAGEYLSLEKPNEILACLGRLPSLGGDGIDAKEAQFLEGCANAAKGKLDSAQKQLEPLMEDETFLRRGECAFWLARGEEENGQFSRAATSYQKAASFLETERSWQATFSAADCLVKDGKHREAGVLFLRIALMGEDKSLAGRSGLAAAGAFRKAGDEEKATTSLKTVIQKFPESDEAKEARDMLRE